MELASLLANFVELPAAPAPLDPKLLPAHGAVFALLDAEHRLIQLLSAQNLRRAALLRLQQPIDAPDSAAAAAHDVCGAGVPTAANEVCGAGVPPAQPAASAAAPSRPRTKRPDLRSVTRSIRWKPAYSTFESALEYLRAARVLLPQAYRKQLGFGPVWFAHVDPAEHLPRWSAQQIAYTGRGIDCGPFDRRALCAEFIQMLEDAFELCRYYDILEQTPHGVPCAYFEMGKCPAPCNGSISLEQYREMIRASADFACGDPESHLAQLQEAMQSAAKALQFERAAGIKQTIERARKLLAAPGRLGANAEDFVYLIVQRGAKPSLVRPFFVDRGIIEASDDVKLAKIEQAAPAWIERLHAARECSAADAVTRSEHVWLVSHFLIKRDATPGLFVHRSVLGEAETLATRIRERFIGGRTP
ncbi:MAG TPA: UvrB/UvrC motif-containing protein [Phycisphaerae bacterium]